MYRMSLVVVGLLMFGNVGSDPFRAVEKVVAAPATPDFGAERSRLATSWPRDKLVETLETTVSRGRASVSNFDQEGRSEVASVGNTQRAFLETRIKWHRQLAAQTQGGFYGERENPSGSARTETQLFINVPRTFNLAQ